MEMALPVGSMKGPLGRRESATVVLLDVTRRYTRLESWLYDRVIAETVLATTSTLIEGILAAVPPDGSVLDVGCGGGQFVLRLANHAPNLRITGVDLSPDQVKRATARAQHHPQVRFQVGSALKLPFPDDHFDAAISIASIKHWPDQSQGVYELIRVLRPGGLLQIAEGDRSCSLADAQAAVRLAVPRPLRTVALMALRTYVLGQGPDLDDARALVAHRRLTQARVERMPSLPMLLISGIKE
jgi:ubiquinone/menaquinone biosynthesis C-methylase UbiE